MAQCKKILPNGERCSNRAVPGTDYCEEHRRQRIQFRPVPKVPTVAAPPAEKRAPKKKPPKPPPPPQWVARPSAAGETPAFPGLRADARNILVAPQGCIWIGVEGAEDQPAPLFDRLVRIGVTQHYALAPGNHVRECECLARMLGFEFTAL